MTTGCKWCDGVGSAPVVGMHDDDGHEMRMACPFCLPMPTLGPPPDLSALLARLAEFERRVFGETLPPTPKTEDSP